MSRFRGSKFKVSRRLGFSITETGKELAKRPYRPGVHGQGRVQEKEYRTQLNEKQKVKFMYGLSEKQFKRTFNEASKMPGIHGEEFLFLLERRLDNIVYRLGFATTRQQARQLVNHGHFTVNGSRMDIPSYRCRVGDVIELKEKSQKIVVIKEALSNSAKKVSFVELDEANFSGKLTALPNRAELNQEIKENLIVELYNR